MIFQDIFKTGVLIVKLKQDLPSIRKFCLDYQKKNKSRQRSNPTGYQSEDVRNRLQIKSLVKDINKYCKIYLTEVLSSKDKPNLNHMWFNINYYKDYNDTHCHPFKQMNKVNLQNTILLVGTCLPKKTLCIYFLLGFTIK